MLAVSLLRCLKWLLVLLRCCLETLNQGGAQEEYLTIYAGAEGIINKWLKEDFIYQMMYVGLHEDKGRTSQAAQQEFARDKH